MPRWSSARRRTRFGWEPGDLDALAGAVVAGHVIECGTQATGGNYAFFERVPGLEHPGFPIAEVAADGSSTITKHAGTGGAVTVGTVTAQLLYEIGAPAYANPDVTARFDTIELADAGADRVRISGVRGEPPPDTAEGGRQLPRRLQQHDDAGAHRARHRGEGRARGAHAVGARAAARRTSTSTSSSCAATVRTPAPPPRRRPTCASR